MHGIRERHPDESFVMDCRPFITHDLLTNLSDCVYRIVL